MPSMIIASDLDGTLIIHDPNIEFNPSDTVSQALFPVIDALQKKDILFCAATGRNYSAIEEHFGKYANIIASLSENGAYVHCKGELLDIIDIPYETAEAITRSVREIPDCLVRINTTEKIYYLVETEEQADLMRSWEYPNALTAFSFNEIKGKITQISAVSLGPVEPVADILIPTWVDKIGVMIAGKHWLDFTNAGKGKGLEVLCKHLGVPLNNTVAFGDNYNDMDMLRIAGTPYIMDTAPADLLAQVPNHTSDALKSIELYCK